MLPFAVAPLLTLDADNFDPAAAAYFAAMSSQPNGTFKTAVNTFVLGMKADGLWAKCDLIYCLAANAAQSAFLNMRSPGNFTLTEPVAGTFTAYGGWAGNGSSAYLDTGYNPTTAGGVYVQNSAHVSIHVNGGAAAGQTSPAMGLIGGGSGGPLLLIPRFSLSPANDVMGRLNDDTTSSLGVTASSTLGHRIMTRTNSTQRRGVIDGGSPATVSQASTGVPNANVALGRGGSGYFNRRIGMATLGSGLTTGDMTNLHTRTLALMTALGAA